jgi:hypothetical protein
MRPTFRIASAALALTAVACAPAAKTDTEFQRDLQLASATTMDLAAPAVNPALLTLENAPAAAPAPAPVIQKAPEAPLAIQSEAPTVEATPEPDPAPVQESVETLTAPAPAPAPVESNEPVAVAPRPQPAPVVAAGGTGAGDYGRGGGVWGNGGGVIIRGGGVDGDHCIPRGRRGGVIFSGPVYVPRPLGGRGSAPSTPTIVRRAAVAPR